MNSKESEFVSLADKLSNPLPQKDPIIKGNKIRSLQTKVVNINEEHIDEETQNVQDIENENVQDTESKIETILEDDIIVGITYTCRCGEESEIRFEFEREKSEDTVVGDHDKDNREDVNTTEDSFIDK